MIISEVLTTFLNVPSMTALWIIIRYYYVLSRLLARRRYPTRPSFTLYVSLTLFLLLSDPLYAFRVSFPRKLAIRRVVVNAEKSIFIAGFMNNVIFVM